MQNPDYFFFSFLELAFNRLYKQTNVHSSECLVNIRLDVFCKQCTTTIS